MCYDMKAMAKRKRLRTQQRERFAEKLMEWGNLVFTGLVIAQIVPGTGPFRLGIAAAGVFAMVVAYLLAYYIMKGGVA